MSEHENECGCGTPQEGPKAHSVGFVSRQEWIAYCASGSYGLSQKGVGIATSEISQEDADEKALTKAKMEANHKLTCSTVPIGAAQLRHHTHRDR